MASPLKQKIIAGVWLSIGGIAGYKTYRKAKDFEEETPCLNHALQKLSTSAAVREATGNGELKVGFWSTKRNIDDVSGLTRASFKVHGESGYAYVFMSSRRGAKAQAAFETALEEEEEQLTGFRYYWSRPWELKRLVVDSTKGVFDRKASTSSSSSSVVEKEPDWDLDTLFYLPNGNTSLPGVLLGNVHGIPEFEALCVSNDSAAKDDRSRRRLQLFALAACGVAVVAGGLRIVRSMGVSKSHGYVRRAILSHPAVVEALGPGASISTTSGTFKPSYLNTRLRLVGANGAAADVDFAATRNSFGGGSWRVAMARMNWAGRQHNLDKSYF